MSVTYTDCAFDWAEPRSAVHSIFFAGYIDVCAAQLGFCLSNISGSAGSDLSDDKLSNTEFNRYQTYLIPTDQIPKLSETKHTDTEFI